MGAASRHEWMPLYAVLSVPALLGVFWLSVTLFAGLTRRYKSEDDREWWSRAGGQWLAWAAAWAGLNALVLLVPPWLLSVPLVKDLPGYASLGGGALVLGLVSSLWGYWSRHGPRLEKQVRSVADRLGMRLLDLAALAFLLLLAVALTFFTSTVLQAGVTGMGPPVQARMDQLTAEHRESLRCKAGCGAPCRPAGCKPEEPALLPPADKL